MADFDDQMEEEWVPPTEGELKIIEARRERQDKISKLLGQYLIRGYKMLATTCPKCSTILMRTRPANGTTAEGEDYCVACNELDSDNSKDDPVLDSTAARSQVLEGQSREIHTQDLRAGNGGTNHMTRMASGDGSAIVGSPEREMEQDSNCAPATEARPSNPEGAVSSAQPMRMGRPDTGSTQIESCTALGCLRKNDPPRVSSDESGSRARCAMMVICPSAKKDLPSSQTADQPTSSQSNPSAVPVSSLYHHHHHHHVHQSDFCPVHNHSNNNQQQSNYNSENTRLRDTLAIVLAKMDWASDQLNKSTEVEQSRQLCSLIACCAEAVSALKAASTPNVAPEDKN